MCRFDFQPPVGSGWISEIAILAMIFDVFIEKLGYTSSNIAHNIHDDSICFAALDLQPDVQLPQIPIRLRIRAGPGWTWFLELLTPGGAAMRVSDVLGRAASISG